MSYEPFRISRRAALRTGAGAAAALGLGGTQLWAAGPAAAADLSYVIDCAGWQARPPSSDVVVSSGTTRKIIVHHTEFPNTTDYSLAAAIDLAQQIQDLHMDGNGWIDTGQHFTVSRGGYVLEGRHRSLEALQAGTFQITGAHCVGENSRGIGIENEGTYFTETPTAALWNSLVRLCTDICGQYGFGAHHMFGHWDYNDTDCPGAAFYRRFPALRLQVAQALGQSRAGIPARTWPDIYTSSAGATVRTLQYLLRARGSKITADGAYGSRTLKAVQAFQRGAGLPASGDGTVTAATWEALVSDTGPGASGDAVRAAQSMLAHKAYAVTVTGTYDDATAAAVGAVRQLHGLPGGDALDTAGWCAVTGGIVAEEFAALP